MWPCTTLIGISKSSNAVARTSTLSKETFPELIKLRVSASTTHQRAIPNAAVKH